MEVHRRTQPLTRHCAATSDYGLPRPILELTTLLLFLIRSVRRLGLLAFSETQSSLRGLEVSVASIRLMISVEGGQAEPKKASRGATRRHAPIATSSTFYLVDLEHSHLLTR